jgi:hypothetical protein
MSFGVKGLNSVVGLMQGTAFPVWLVLCKVQHSQCGWYCARYSIPSDVAVGSGLWHVMLCCEASYSLCS